MKERSIWQIRGRLAAAAKMRDRRRSGIQARRGPDVALLLEAMRATGCYPGASDMAADRAFADLLGVYERSVRRWRDGTVHMKGPVHALCQLIVARPENAQL